MPTPPRRRWFRYSLRTMFALVTLAGIFLGSIAREWRIVQHRKTVLAEVDAQVRSGLWTEPPERFSVRWILGDRRVHMIFIDPTGETPCDWLTVQAAFPEAELSFNSAMFDYNLHTEIGEPPIAAKYSVILPPAPKPLSAIDRIRRVFATQFGE